MEIYDFDKENNVAICNKCMQPFKHRQGGGQRETRGLNRHLLSYVQIQGKEAKSLVDRKKRIPLMILILVLMNW